MARRQATLGNAYLYASLRVHFVKVIAEALCGSAAPSDIPRRRVARRGLENAVGHRHLHMGHKYLYVSFGGQNRGALQGAGA